MAQMLSIKISGKTVQAERGANLLEIAQSARLDMTATCGARGRCRSCRVRLVRGKLNPPTLQDRVRLGAEGVREGFRLGCQTQVLDDCEVEITPAKEEAGHQIFFNDEGQSYSGVVPPSGVEKHLVKAEAPLDEHDMSSDLEEMLKVLPDGIERVPSVKVLRNVPNTLRDMNGNLTVTTFNNEIIDPEAGDTTVQNYGMAFDIGTTSVVGSLINLITGEKLASVGGINPQAVYGGDLMSRIAYA